MTTQTFRRGVIDGIPIVLAYAAFSSAFGILAVKAGLPVWAAVAMSIVGYAGSAQFVVISLITAGSGLPLMLGATFLLNLRHLLLSSSLSTKLPPLRKRQLTYLAHSITDESYGVNMVRAQKQGTLDYASVMGTNIIAHTAWVLATWVGASCVQWITADLSFMNAALPLMFASLLAFQLSTMQDCAWAIFAGAITLVLMHFIPGQGAFLVTVLLVPTIGMLVDLSKKKVRRAT
jgi:4-azaleucine resistance transporter AzlC